MDDYPPQSDSSFKSRTIQRLAEYYVLSQRLMDQVYLECDGDRKVIEEFNQGVQERFRLDPRSPKDYYSSSLTISAVNTFYEQCDSICKVPLSTTHEKVDANYACTVAVHFIRNILAPQNLDIPRHASTLALNMYQNKPVDFGTLPNHSRAYTIGTTFEHWTQTGSKRTIEIKDHGTSAMKGEYYIIGEPGDDEGWEEEISKSEMDNLIACDTE
ncbi:hypothetical protein APHAL10511_000336 [Amanita phalloides]|nr:hypothetical protein APHAL10511_000336 [Amanita phalloides]